LRYFAGLTGEQAASARIDLAAVRNRPEFRQFVAEITSRNIGSAVE
jgi:hypothetical protein